MPAIFLRQDTVQDTGTVLLLAVVDHGDEVSNRTTFLTE